MKKKRAALRVVPAVNATPRSLHESWHNGAEIKIGLYSRKRSR
jgi:hypothetical protein